MNDFVRKRCALLIFLLIILVVVPVTAYTTELTVRRYAVDGLTPTNETTKSYQWLEANLPIKGDGNTYYYFQKPVYENEWETNYGVNYPEYRTDWSGTPPYWNQSEERWDRLYNGTGYDQLEEVNWKPNNLGKLKGTDLKDLCNLVGGLSQGKTVRILGEDGLSKDLPYSAVYSPNPHLGPYVVTWWSVDAGESGVTNGYTGPQYTNGMRGTFFADNSRNNDGMHVAGLGDMVEGLPEQYWYYNVFPDAPSLGGYTVKYINRIYVYSNDPVPLPSANFTANIKTGQIINGNFETGLLTPWTGGAATVSNTYSYKKDSYSLRLLAPASGSAWIQQSVDLTNVGSINFWRHYFGGAGKYMEVLVDDIVVANYTETTTVPNDLETIDITSYGFTGSHMIKFNAMNTNPSGSFTVYLDNIEDYGPGTSGNGPLIVQFTDLSTKMEDPAHTSWAWDFYNNGTTTSTERNPLFTYTANGTYTVKLTVTNAGGSDAETKIGYITVGTVTPPDTMAPRSVTSLANNTYLMTSITWVWIDPTDTDFDRVMVYLDGTWKTNVSKGVQLYSATGLTADTQHILGTRTVDATGNVNTSWANHTARTAPLPDTTPPRSVTGLANNTYLMTSITWVWTDPTDTDFDRVMVYLDGTWKTNVSKAVQLYSATGLTADTQHILGTRTVDATGNVNTSWANRTARTAPLPDTTAPRSVTGLTNSTYLMTSITWVWTDPTDTDFDRVMMYLDGTWKTNVSKGVQLYSATGLTADTQHIIGTRTVDTTGNINQTWVNHTARTAPLPDTTVPRSVTGLINSTYLMTSINWVWTDPTDADFDRVMVYLDGTWKQNVTKGVQVYSATGLTVDTQHIIGTRTVDTTGNINQTWVNHTARTAPLPDTTAPRSVTGLTNTTFAMTSINWVWTDPTDADFNKVMLYLDGTFRTNVTKGVQVYSATGLTADSQHTIATKTVDTTGNVNASWVNHTARTAPLPDTTAPKSVTGLTNTTFAMTSINWVWTDPTDADFDRVMVYLDGTWRTNVTKGVQLYSATGLTADTQHIIGTRTVDTTGNINQTWVNHTTRTASLPDTTAPRSVTGLVNSTYLMTSINWVWTDPADADFSKVMVYLDGTWRTNVTKAVQVYSATGLTADSQHIIGTRTVDTTGNINQTWVNHTARTAPLPDSTAPRSVTGLTNTTYAMTSINWVWTDPTDADFSKVMVYLDGTWRTNVTKGVQVYSATGLAADTQHIIGTKTVDTTGNVNQTWVNHTARTAPLPDTTAPRSVTNLVNNSFAMTSINWLWTDPTDPDFDRVMVYLDGTWRTNVTKGVQLYSATGLTADTQHIIGTRTVDTTGNINQTWVNHTARTAPLPDTTAPRSITGLVNSTYLMTSINWVWTDPADADFSKVMVYLDGVWTTNVTKGVQIYSATGLTADTQHIIGTRTVDTTGNINQTWVNHTARTAPLPDSTAPWSVTDLTNTTYAMTSINWVWTDPTDPDFDRVMVYLDGTWRTNVTKGVQLYSATGLTADTQHIIGTRTVDTTGNVNASWVNHTARTAPAPDTTPPQSVTGLVNTTYAITSINWVWTDPTDADFSKVMVYLDGTWKTNVSKGVQLYSVTGLTADTQHIIGTRTVDITGNVNASWVNHTARTAPAPDTTPPRSVTGLVNTTYAITSINWVWTDPTDADFSKVMVYLDGVWTTNVTKGVQIYSATGLTADTQHIIGTRTVDTTGNVNASWVNHTARTAPVAPLAGFSGTPTFGLVPLTVHFTDESVGDITGYSWEFGDGVTSTDQNPNHQYTVAGIYDVLLTVTGPGGSGKEVKTGYITVKAPPVAIFTADPVSGTVPLAVQFTDNSLYAETWSWNFGDKSISHEQNPVHIYTKAGHYTVTLIITNTVGSDTITKKNLITVIHPVALKANFNAETTRGSSPLTVHFMESSSGSIDSYIWDFGDGITSTEQNPVHIYMNEGRYNVTLTITNTFDSDSITKKNYVMVK